MNRYSRPIAWLALAAACLASTATAQQSSGTITITPFSVEGFVKGNRHNIDAEFAAEHNVSVPAPFSFIAPTSKTHLNYTKPAPGGTGIFKVFFVTLEKTVKSNLQFLPLRVDEGELESRLNAIGKVSRDVFGKLVPDPERAEINVTRLVEIGPYQAVETIGRYDGGENGVIVMRVVAILNPDGENSMLAVINALSKNLPMETVEDILKTDAARALGTFRFE